MKNKNAIFINGPQTSLSAVLRSTLSRSALFFRSTSLHFAINRRPSPSFSGLSLHLAVPPSQPSSICRLAADHTRDAELLNSSSGPSNYPISRPLCPRVSPSINHASSSRAASLDFSHPSAHPLKTLISISCLHSVS